MLLLKVSHFYFHVVAVGALSAVIQMRLDAVKQVDGTQLYGDARSGTFHVVIHVNGLVISDAIYAHQFPTIVWCTIDQLQKIVPTKYRHDVLNCTSAPSSGVARLTSLTSKKGPVGRCGKEVGFSLLLDRVQNHRIGELAQRTHHV